MTRRNMVIALAAVAIAVAAAAIWFRTSRPPTDCEIARQMIEYNNSHVAEIKSKTDPDRGIEPSVDDYRPWAQRMHDYADRIHRADVSAPAHRLAADADRMVALVQQARSDAEPGGDPGGAPSSEQQYVELSKDFQTNMAALDAACPAS